MQTVLNLLPLTGEERAAFTAAAPDFRHLFRPVDLVTPRAMAGAREDYAAADVILGCPAEEKLAAARRLKWLQMWSAGADRYLAPGVLPHPVALTTAVGAYGPAVSEHMLAMLLALYKRLPEYDRQRQGRLWADAGPARSLIGQTVLVGGTGDIGVHFARLCRALGAAEIVGLHRSGEPVAGFDEAFPLSAIDSLLPRADVVALALPQAPETVHIMDRRRLFLMKEGAILLNGGRGSAIDPEGLNQVLNAGRLWGAALDVTEPEPLPADSPLWDQPDLLLTPHVAGGLHLEGTRERIVAIALENLKRYLAGEPLKNRMK